MVLDLYAHPQIMKHPGVRSKKEYGFSKLRDSPTETTTNFSVDSTRRRNEDTQSYERFAWMKLNSGSGAVCALDSMVDYAKWTRTVMERSVALLGVGSKE